MKKTTIIETITILYLILFLYTGISKLIDYSVFKEQIATSSVLSPVAQPVAVLVPAIEFAIVLLLIVPKWRLIGLYSSAILMTIFTGYIIVIMSFSVHLPCSCGGIIELLSWKQHLFFNSVFIALAYWASLLQRRYKIGQQKLWNASNNLVVIAYSFIITYFLNN